jgi:hypothetical protein
MCAPRKPIPMTSTFSHHPDYVSTGIDKKKVQQLWSLDECENWNDVMSPPWNKNKAPS